MMLFDLHLHLLFLIKIHNLLLLKLEHVLLTQNKDMIQVFKYLYISFIL